ncbi:peptidoglycan-binding protein [Bacillus gobiensis]|uniref:peptidoglycan-binding protein n=1 Tax=Bacillus gobiensis TaxID=1441095 RepID=UPI003D23CD3F
MARVSLETLLDRSVDRMGSGMHPVVKETALEVIKRAYKEGINAQISDGYRSFAEQNALYAKGRTAPGDIVTNARGGQSNHNYGLAVDYFLVSEDGREAIWKINSDWKRVAQIAKSLGFEWGGDWRSFKDNPHLEMMGGLSLRDLQNGKRPTLVSKVTGKSETVKVESKPVEVEKDEPKKEVAKKDSPFLTFQKWLNKHYNAGLVEDGIPGSKTKKAALKAFQKEIGTKSDGVWGRDTERKTPVIRNGKTNDKQIVYILQGMLYFYEFNPNGLDSVYGDGSESALKELQGKFRLKKDGLPGAQTFKAIFS